MATGIPESLAQLEDTIFEGLPRDEARQWPERFLGAIRPGADLSRVTPRVLVRLIGRRREAVLTLAIEESLRAQVVAAIDDVLVVLRDWAETGVLDVDAAVSAERAAVSAESAAWAATSAERAAESAAWAATSAAWAAESAARAAWAAVSAAWAAVSAAESAAWDAEYSHIADDLIAELEAAPVPS